MSRRLPLYAERALGELQATRGYTVTEYEKQYREEHAVTCRAGCAHCCHYPIHISIGEGLLLYRFLSGKGRLTSELRKKLRVHGDLTMFLDSAVWMRASIPCPLLDEKNRCAGYEGRPLICRLRFSAGDADDCNPQSLNPENMADIKELSSVFSAMERRLLKAHGISSIGMSVGRALILAEKVLTGEIDLNRIERELLREYVTP